MAGQTFAADVKKFAALTQRQMRRVVVDSLQDVLEGAQTSAKGVSAGGTITEGKIPVVSGDLINSLAVEINGARVAEGYFSYTTIVTDFNLGDYMRFGWTIEYALRVEAGFNGTDSAGRTFNQSGWHFVSHNAARWPGLVKSYTAKYAVK